MAFRSRKRADQRALARELVGGLWEEMGQAQFDFLVSRGLKPTDVMLDVGCGALRGGVHFIRYLDAGNYYGVDRAQGMLDVGLVELRDAGLADRAPVLRCDATFDFPAFGTLFDVALAQSVFTHINLNAIHRCLVRIAEVLKPGGVFYATFLENRGDPHDLSPITFPQPDMAPTVTYPDKNPYHYPLRFFEDLIEGLPLRLEYIGEWGSLRGQSMLAFTRT
jgi:ubiquinone/menaquinone biosynthesis C-methylase UbiE